MNDYTKILEKISVIKLKNNSIIKQKSRLPASSLGSQLFGELQCLPPYTS